MGSADEKRKILVMDDEEMIGEIACQMLSFLGYEAQHVLDGEAAIQRYREQLERGAAFDVVIMDLTIPGGMGGKEAVAEILALDPQAKVLVSSGYSNDPSMTHYSEHGFCGHIDKPFDMTSLKTAIEAVI